MRFEFCYYLLLVFFCGNNLYAAEIEVVVDDKKNKNNKPNTDIKNMSNINKDSVSLTKLNNITLESTNNHSSKRDRYLSIQIDEPTPRPKNKNTEEKFFTTENISLLASLGLGLALIYYCKRNFLNH